MSRAEMLGILDRMLVRLATDGVISRNDVLALRQLFEMVAGEKIP